MVNALSMVSMQAFSDELCKEAGLGDRLATGATSLYSKLRTAVSSPNRWQTAKNVGSAIVNKPKEFGIRSAMRVAKESKEFMGDAQAAANRVTHPIEGLAEGWKATLPQNSMTRDVKRLITPENLQKNPALQGVGTIQDLAKADPALAKSILGKGGGHHLNPSQSFGEAWNTGDGFGGKLRNVAEEASRRGITGEGSSFLGSGTKYLPVGNRGLLALGAADTIHSAVNAPSPTPTGQGSGFEKGLGEAAGTLGAITGTGLGFVPAMGLMAGGHAIGSRAGRVIDRLRAGANLRDAVYAPSPQEAEHQMQNINRYYGGGQ